MFDFIVSLIESAGAFGVGLLMFGENLFPPIPSELIMPLAGFSAADGRLNLVAVLIAGIVGSLAGAFLWYYVGLAVGEARLRRWAGRNGRWMTLSPADVDRASAWFARHGGIAVFLGRLVPGVRTLISVPAGVARMPLVPFLAWSLLGTAIWTAFLTGLGYILRDQYDRVSDWMNPVSNAVIIALVLGYLWRLWRFDPDSAT